jgi:hypothetical protein
MVTMPQGSGSRGPAPRHALSATLLKGVVVLLGVAAGVGLFYLGFTRSPEPLAIALTLVAKAATDGLPKGAASARLRVSTAIACAVVAGALGYGLWSGLPRVPVPPSLDPIHDAFRLVATFVALSFGSLAFGVGLLAAYVFFWLVSWKRRTGLLRLAGVLATTLLAALSLLGVVRSATRPSPERYLAGLMAGSTTPDPPQPGVRVFATRTPPEETRRVVGDLVVVSRCGNFESCDLGVFARESPPAAGDSANLPFRVATRSEFEVTRLSPDLVLVRAAWQESRFYRSPVVHDALFRRHGERWSLSPDEDLVAGKAGPPRSWVAGGLVGLALAIAAWRRHTQALRRWRTLARAEDAGPPAPEVGPGSDTEELTRWEAWALAISCLAAAPLAAAAMAGLLLSR